jgi:hypothetical protein
MRVPMIVDYEARLRGLVERFEHDCARIREARTKPRLQDKKKRPICRVDRSMRRLRGWTRSRSITRASARRCV